MNRRMSVRMFVFFFSFFQLLKKKEEKKRQSQNKVKYFRNVGKR